MKNKRTINIVETPNTYHTNLKKQKLSNYGVPQNNLLLNSIIRYIKHNETKLLSSNEIETLIKKQVLCDIGDGIGNSDNSNNYLTDDLPNNLYENIIIGLGDYYRFNEYTKENTKNNLTYALYYYKLLLGQKENKIYGKIADIYTELENFEEAKKFYIQDIEFNSTNNEDNNVITSYYKLAKIYLNEKNSALTKKYARLGVEKGDSKCLILLAETYVLESKIEKAKQFFMKSIVSEQNIPAMIGLANIAKQENNINDHIKYLKMAAKTGDNKSCHALACHYEHLGDYINMEEYYNQAISRGYVDSMNNLGVYYHHIKKDTVNALKYYNMAVKNGYTNAYNNMGMLYLECDKLQEAKEFFLRNIDTGGHKSLYNIACLYEQENNIPVAIEYHMKSINKDNNYSYLRLGLIYKYKENEQLALEFFNKGKEKGIIQCNHELAKIQVRNGKVDDAFAIYLELLYEKRYDYNAKMFKLIPLVTNTNLLSKFYFETISISNICYLDLATPESKKDRFINYLNENYKTIEWNMSYHKYYNIPELANMKQNVFLLLCIFKTNSSYLKKYVCNKWILQKILQLYCKKTIDSLK